MRKTISFLCIALVLVISGCKDKVKPGAVEARREPVTGVTLMTIMPSTIDSFYETSGTVKAKTTSLVASRTMGTVTKVQVKEGDRVKAGDLLLTIDDRDMVQKVNGAEAGHREALKGMEAAAQHKALAGVTFTRYKNLYTEKVISQQEMDQIETGKKVADAEYDRAGETVKRALAAVGEARLYQGFARITAPVSGVVSSKRIDEGSLAIPGMPLMVIDDTSRFKVETFLDERVAGKFTVGMPVFVLLDASGERLPASIEEMARSVDPASRTLLARISVQGTSLKSGLYCKVLFPEGKREAILVPKKAVVQRGQLTGVYVTDNKGVMTYRLIKTGKQYDQNTEVLSGLKGGELVVVGGVEKAVDGGVVRQ